MRFAKIPMAVTKTEKFVWRDAMPIWFLKFGIGAMSKSFLISSCLISLPARLDRQAGTIATPPDWSYHFAFGEIARMALIDWDQPEYLELPDLHMAVFQAGTPRKDRPAVVLCHGFPEIAYSWRHIIAPLVEAGFHVIAPDQRGFGYTGLAKSDTGEAGSVPLYDMQHLCDDLAAMLDALDIEQAVFVGHDWGGFVTWQLPFYHPSRVAGLVGVNTPFIPRLAQDPIATFRQALGDDFYIVAFQEHGHVEGVLDADTARALRCFYRGPDAENSHEVGELGPGWENFAILKILDSDEAGWPGKQLLHPADFDHYHRAFARSGFRGGINWYRNFTRNWEMSVDFEQKVDVPSLMVCAEKDTFLPPSMAENMPKYVADLETHLIRDCGHWTQNEKPEELSRLMRDWLSRRFG